MPKYVPLIPKASSNKKEYKPLPQPKVKHKYKPLPIPKGEKKYVPLPIPKGEKKYVPLLRSKTIEEKVNTEEERKAVTATPLFYERISSDAQPIKLIGINPNIRPTIPDPENLTFVQHMQLKSAVPSWFTGFTRDSYISIEMAATGMEDIENALFGFSFKNPYDSESDPITFLFAINISSKYYQPYKFYFAREIGYEAALNRFLESSEEYQTIKKIPYFLKTYFKITEPITNKYINDHERSSLLIRSQETKWLRGKSSRFDFDDIRFTNLTCPIRLKKVEIWLNDVRILRRDYECALIEKGEGRHYHNKIKEYRHHMVRYGSDNDSEILKYASEEVGRANPARYRVDDSYWNYDETYQLWAHKNRPFCSEFTSWAIRNGTKESEEPLYPRCATIPPYDASEPEEKKLKSTVYYYKKVGRWVGKPDTGQFTAEQYADLEWKIKPGCYCCFWREEDYQYGGSGHSMIFVRWLHKDFSLDGISRMQVISGSDGGRVAVGEATVSIKENTTSKDAWKTHIFLDYKNGNNGFGLTY